MFNFTAKQSQKKRTEKEKKSLLYRKIFLSHKCITKYSEPLNKIKLILENKKSNVVKKSARAKKKKNITRNQLQWGLETISHMGLKHWYNRNSKVFILSLIAQEHKAQ